VCVQDFTPGKEYSYVVDVDPSSFDEPHVVEALDSARTIFVNAVMGLMPNFWQGTSKMDERIDCNRAAQKFFGGGDTLQEFKR
jgi:phosphoglycerate kinase